MNVDDQITMLKSLSFSLCVIFWRRRVFEEEEYLRKSGVWSCALASCIGLKDPSTSSVICIQTRLSRLVLVPGFFLSSHLLRFSIFACNTSLSLALFECVWGGVWRRKKREDGRWFISVFSTAVHAAVVAAAEKDSRESISLLVFFSIERESPVLLSFNPSISPIVLCILLGLSLKHHFGLWCKIGVYKRKWLSCMSLSSSLEIRHLKQEYFNVHSHWFFLKLINQVYCIESRLQFNWSRERSTATFLLCNHHGFLCLEWWQVSTDIWSLDVG